MKLSFNPKTIPSLFRKYIHFFLWGFLAFVILMEFFVIKEAVDMVLLASNPAPGVQSRIIKVDFEQYKLIEKRLEDSAQYEPGAITYPNPFGVVDTTP